MPGYRVKIAACGPSALSQDHLALLVCGLRSKRLDLHISPYASIHLYMPPYIFLCLQLSPLHVSTDHLHQAAEHLLGESCLTFNQKLHLSDSSETRQARSSSRQSQVALCGFSICRRKLQGKVRHMSSLASVCQFASRTALSRATCTAESHQACAVGPSSNSAILKPSGSASMPIVELRLTNGCTAQARLC